MQVQPSDLETEWSAIRHAIREHLEAYMDLGDDCPNTLQQSMAYSLNSGGKLVRGALVVFACEACGGTREAAMPAACAVEMVHTYSLIHDDLPSMDDDEFRRGQPTNHRVFGEAGAILAGDALQSLAFEVLAREIEPSHIAADCVRSLARAIGPTGMVAGQVADLQASETPVTEVRELEAIHRRKTGALLACCPYLGGRIANAPTTTLRRLEEFGRSVGLAFQIADDLLDVCGDSERLGKGTQKDAQHGKSTYPAICGITDSQERAKALVETACRSVACLEDDAQQLEALARFVLERDH